MNRYGNRCGIRYSETNGLLHIVIGRYHLKIGRKVFIIENAKTLKATWLYGWN